MPPKPAGQKTTRAAGPFRRSAEGLRVALRVQPNARRTAIDGPAVLHDGARVLRLRVGAPAEGGKANAAVLRLLAKAWDLPKSRLALVAGHADRRKLVEVSGDPAELEARLEAWLAALPGAKGDRGDKDDKRR